MASYLNLYATVSGQSNMTWPGFAVGETVRYNLTCLDPADESQPLNLTALAVIFSMKAIDVRGLPAGTVIISREATITDAANGICYAPIASGDTVPAGIPIPPGNYDVDVWAEDTNGDRLDLGYGQLAITAAVRLPNDPITPLPEQEPLAQGPQGPPGPAGPTNPLSDTNPLPVGVVSPGVADTGSRSDHVHAHGNQAGGLLHAEATTSAAGFVPAVSAVSGSVPVSNGTAYVPRRLNFNDIDPAFVISSFAASGFSTTKEIGDSIVNPQFTATYNQSPVSATLNDGTGALSISTFNSFGYNTSPLPARTFSVSTINGTTTFTLVATGTGTDSASVAVSWRAREYYGISADPGTYNSAFILGLSTSRLSTSETGSYVFSAPSPASYLWICYPTSDGVPSSIKDQNGFVFPMSSVATGVALVNSFSVNVTGGYTILRSDNLINQAFTLTVA